MAAWWGDLSALGRTFYVVAVFFSTIFLWQLVSSVMSLGDGQVDGGGADDVGGDADMSADGGIGVDVMSAEPIDMDGDAQDFTNDAAGLATFRLLSVRSILAFGTLFSWAGAFYLDQGNLQSLALLRAFLWGLAGMVVVALFFWVLPRLAETGTSDPASALGRPGEVYMDIPDDGVGQIKVIVSGALQFVRARSADGRALRAGTAVRVISVSGGSVLEVEPIEV